MHIAKWKKPIWIVHILYNPNYMAFQKRQNYLDNKKISSCQSLSGSKGRDMNIQNTGIFRVIKLLCMILQWWISSVQSLSHVWLFATPWTTACQASLSITNSQSPPKPMSIKLVMPSNHLILCCPLPPALNFPQHQGLLMSQLLASGGQSIGVSASTSVFLMNTQNWSPLGWTG